MTKTKVYCDHCGKEIDQRTNGFTDEIMIATVHIHCDLCDDCMDELVNIINDYLTNATAAKGGVNMITKDKAREILERFDFFGGQRAGRELWNDKPKDIQDKDIEAFSRDCKLLIEFVEEMSKHDRA